MHIDRDHVTIVIRFLYEFIVSIVYMLSITVTSPSYRHILDLSCNLSLPPTQLRARSLARLLVYSSCSPAHARARVVDLELLISHLSQAVSPHVASITALVIARCSCLLLAALTADPDSRYALQVCIMICVLHLHSFIPFSHIIPSLLITLIGRTKLTFPRGLAIFAPVARAVLALPRFGLHHR